MRIKRLATGALFAVAILTACTGGDAPTAPTTPSLRVEDAGHNAADHFKVVEAVELEVESPCNGELIAFSGEAIYQTTLVGTREALDAGFSVHREFQSRLQATGIGQESGATYTIKEIFHENFESPSPPAPQFTFSLGSMFQVTSDLPGLSFDGHFGLHALALPSGAFKVTRELESVECKV